MVIVTQITSQETKQLGLVEKYLLFIQGQHAEHQRLQGQTMMNDDFSNLLIIKSLTTLEFSILAKKL